MNDLAKKTINGVKWSAIQQILTQLSTLVVGIILMRLISPAEFGLLAMVTVFSGFLSVFQDFGLSSSLIQKKELTDSDSQVVFWVLLGSGIILSVVMFSTAGLISDFYGEEKVKNIAKVLSFSFIIGVFGTVNATLLKKEMEFKIISIYRSSAVIIGGLVGIILAYCNYGVWSLVVQSLVVTSLTSLLIGFKGKFRPSLNFEWSTLKEHLNFGIPLFGSRGLTYFSKNIDKILIGKFLNKTDLGVYSRAYSLLYLPVHKLTMIFTTVLYSSFSKIKEQKDKIGEIYLRITNILVFLFSPFLVLLFCYTHEIITFMFGEEWIEIVQLVKIFIFLIIFHIVSLLRSNINLAQGYSKYELYFNLIGTSTDVVAVIIGVMYGLDWIAINLVISMLIKAITAIYLISKSLEIKATYFGLGLIRSYGFFFLLLTTGLFMRTIIHAFLFNVVLEYTLFTVIIFTLTALGLYLLDIKSFFFLKDNFKLSRNGKKI